MTKLISISLTFIILIIPQLGFSINPMKEYKMTPEQFKLAYEEVKIKTADGALLNTWVMKTSVEEKKNATFVIAGSDAGNMGFSLPYAINLLNRGYDVITFDYRGFGGSSDFEYKADNLYHNEYIEDFVSVINWVREELKVENIAVLSFSMGTLVATEGYKQAKFDVFIGEGFLKCPKDVIQRIKQTKGKQILLPPKAELRCKQTVSLKIPILLFASTQDEVTTLSDSEEVVAQKQNRRLVKFEGAHLRGAFTLGFRTYLDEIDRVVRMIEKK